MHDDLCDFISFDFVAAGQMVGTDQYEHVTALAAGAVAGRAEDMVDHIMMIGHKQCQAIKMVGLCI